MFVVNRKIKEAPEGCEHSANLHNSTPYLMPGDALFDAFIRAAKRGVDVRLIMPGIPDQKLLLKDLKADYLKTQEECEEITLESLNHGKFHKFVDNLLRLAAPLM